MTCRKDSCNYCNLGSNLFRPWKPATCASRITSILSLFHFIVMKYKGTFSFCACRNYHTRNSKIILIYNLMIIKVKHNRPQHKGYKGMVNYSKLCWLCKLYLQPYCRLHAMPTIPCTKLFYVNIVSDELFSFYYKLLLFLKNKVPGSWKLSMRYLTVLYNARLQLLYCTAP